MLNIVLYEPEIPENTGNIMRTCAATGSRLIMVKPLGFIMEDKYFKRAGMDYLDFANVEVVDSFEQIIEANPGKQFFFASTKSKHTHTEVKYPNDCFIVFGKESYGLKETLLKKYYDNCIRIPMKETARSLNLSNSVAIVLYEALRQNNFESLKEYGELTGRSENEF